MVSLHWAAVCGGPGSGQQTACVCLVAQSCPTPCDPMDPLPGCSVHGDSPGKNTEVGYHTLLQGVFPTQGLNLGLPHCRRILYPLRHWESQQGEKWIRTNSICCLVYETFPLWIFYLTKCYEVSFLSPLCRQANWALERQCHLLRTCQWIKALTTSVNMSVSMPLHQHRVFSFFKFC